MTEANFRFGNTRVRILEGDITEMKTDAIVNAANSSLLGGGGVDGAIHRKGGSKILEECKLLRAKEWPKGLPTGKAVITTGGNLEARYVIHTVGPMWRGGNQKEPELLAEAYRHSLMLAISRGMRTIAFPSISTGAYGYPIEKASRIAITAIMHTVQKEDSLDEVVLVMFSKNDFEIYRRAAEEILRREF